MMVEGSSDVPKDSAIGQGRSIEICHHPENPGKNFIAGSTSVLGTSCLTIFMLVFVTIGGSLLALAYWLTWGGG